MKYEVEVIIDLYNDDGKLIKKDVIQKRIFELSNIQLEQYYNEKGVIQKKYSCVIDDGKYYKINKPYEEMSPLVKPVHVKGFIRYEEKIKTNKTGRGTGRTTRTLRTK